MAEPRLIISNTTPLINFAQIGCFDLLEQELGSIYVSPVVLGELDSKARTFKRAADLSHIICC